MARYEGRHRAAPTTPARRAGGAHRPAQPARRAITHPLVAAGAAAGVGFGALGLATAVSAGQNTQAETGMDLTARTQQLTQAAMADSVDRAHEAVSRSTARTTLAATDPKAVEAAKQAAAATKAAETKKAAEAKAAEAERQRQVVIANAKVVIANAKNDPKSAARMLMADHGWTSDRQYSCLVNLWTGESDWRWSAENQSSGAYGIPQSLPARKMAQFGSDYRTNPITQMKWGLWYIEASYGSPCSAWSFWQSKSPHWY